MSKRKTVGYDWEFGHEELEVQVASYHYGDGLYIGLLNAKDGEPFGDLTVNIPFQPCGVNEAYIDDFSAKDKLSFIKKHKLGKVLPEKGHSGYCTYSKVAFDLERLAELDSKGVEKYKRLHGLEGSQEKPKKKCAGRER